MTSIELLEDLFNDIEFITRLDFVDPILRGEARDHLNEIYWKQSKNLEKIKRELKVLDVLKDKILNHSDYKISGWAELNFEIDEADSKEEKEKNMLIKRWLNEEND